tara:strand:- start:570 stop:1589 length:1020 start_codon:yes stop_codon:yes gene_type:complete
MPTQVRLVSPTAQQTYSLSGGTGYHSSGISPASATTSGLNGFAPSGPWYIERQSMSVTYWRVPIEVARQATTSQDWALSGGSPNSIVSGNINMTALAYRVDAHVSIIKSYDNFGTSSYIQPQKMVLQPISTDMNGDEYNTIPVGRLGPRGTIITSEDFVNRRPWVEGTDSTYSKTITGYNWSITDTCYVSSNHVGNADGVRSYIASVAAQSEFIGDYTPFFFGEYNFYELLGSTMWHPKPTPGASAKNYVVNKPSAWSSHSMFGGYNSANEASGIARWFVDEVAYYINTGTLFNDDYATRTFDPNSRDDYATTNNKLQGQLKATGNDLPRYDVNRHSYE